MKILALSNLYPPDFVGGYELGVPTSSTPSATAGTTSGS